MKKKLFSAFAGLFLIGLTSGIFAQGKVSGLIVDADTQEPLIGAAVYLQDDKGVGTITRLDGSFQMQLENGSYDLVFSYLGYIDLEKTIEVSGDTDLGRIELKSSSVGIVEVSIVASVATDRKTPVALSSIKADLIEEKLGTQEFPEILKSTPGIYASKQGGGFGDSRVNVRGFDMRNTAVMFNGIPVNDMENGWVYWSNWAGLSDVTRTMQIQRGLGASRLSIGSVGGTINILTKTTDAQKGGTIYTGVGNNGYNKQSVSVSTGQTEDNWAVTFLGARQSGQGWADATSFEGWSYFINISKQWDRHMLSFVATGAPQEHGQRRTRQYISTVKDPNKGLRYNSDWGYKNGQQTNLNTNFYHKPQMSLSHYFTVNDKLNLSNTLYASFGTGGGTGEYGETSKFFEYKREGQIDFDRIVDENMESGNGRSSSIMRNSRNDHDWYGLLSNAIYELNNNWTISGGLDLRYYEGKHYREVSDLLGGEYYIDSGRDQNNLEKVVRVGDKINYHNVGQVNWTGLFAQAEYESGPLTAFISGSVSNTGYRRIDYFNYVNSDPEQKSDWINYTGFVFKGGASYNVSEKSNVFANIGYFERAPTFDNTFLNFRNDINEGANNEKVFSVEAGYRYRSRKFSGNINGYYTNWIDKFFRRSVTAPSGERVNANISGVNALHMGIEMDFVWQPVNKLEVRGMASLGDWRWQNDITDVPIFDDDQNLIETVNLYIKDLKVGDAAQTSAALGLNYLLMKDLKVGVDYTYYNNLYAQFDPTGRQDPDKAGVNSWQLPKYGLLDANARYNFTIAGLSATWYANVFNIINTEYISDANDGSDNNAETALVFFGIGRSWSTGIKVRF